MSTCALAPSLSAYVDGELAVPRRREVERHLAECPQCRHEIAALRDMVRRLQSLAPIAPPPTLNAAVARRIAAEPIAVGRFERWEATLRRFALPTTMIPLAAWVMALAVMGLFLVRVVGPEVSPGVGTSPTSPAIDFVSQQAVLAVLGGKVFERRDDRWCEEGACETGIEEISRRLSFASPAAVSLRQNLPGVERLLGSGLPLILRYEGELIALEPPGTELAPNGIPPIQDQP